MAKEIKVTDLCKSFGSNKVIERFNFTFKFKKIYKIAGPNGSGKTTLLKLLANIHLPDSGKIDFLETDNQQVTYIDNNPRSFFHRLSVIDNLQYFLALNKIFLSDHEIDEMLIYFDLYKYKTKLFSDLSQGQMQTISIIRGLLNNQQIIALDESFSFLDMSIKNKLREYLFNLMKDKDMLLLFCSHENDLFTKDSFLEINL